jgi:protein tyrosine/serine phosphatase
MKFSLQALLVILLSVFVLQAAHASGIYGVSEVDRGLYRGSRPSKDADFQQLKELGIKTILSLQSSILWKLPEEKKALKKGYNFINLRIFAFSPYIANNRMVKILDTMRDESLKPIYVHCQFGRDRTSLAIGMYRVHAQKWTPEAAYQEMREFGFQPGVVWGLYHYFRTHQTLESLPFSVLAGEEDDPVQVPESLEGDEVSEAS